MTRNGRPPVIRQAPTARKDRGGVRATGLEPTTCRLCLSHDFWLAFHTLFGAWSAFDALSVGSNFMSRFMKSMSDPSAEGTSRNTITVDATVTVHERFSCIQPPLERKTKKTSSEKQIAVKLPFEVVTGEIPKPMLDRLARNFTEAELDQILMRCGRTMAPAIDGTPAVLFVLGPSAVGKSYITDASAAQLFGGSYNAVILDGEVFRESHAGWTEVVLHGMKRHVLHQDAWTIFKDVKVEESPGAKVRPADSQVLRVCGCARGPPATGTREPLL